MVRSVETELAHLDEKKVEMWKKMCGGSEVVVDEVVAEAREVELCEGEDFSL